MCHIYIAKLKYTKFRPLSMKIAENNLKVRYKTKNSKVYFLIYKTREIQMRG